MRRRQERDPENRSKQPAASRRENTSQASRIERYFTTPITSRYSDCTRVVPSVARL